MSVSLKIVSLNIERSKHFDLVLPFLGREHSEVVCIQELIEHDIPLFEKALQAQCIFAPMTRYPEGNPRSVMGVGIFSHLSKTHSAIHYYRGGSSSLQDFDMTNAKTKSETAHHLVLFCDFKKEDSVFRIGTTHFPWTPDGQADDIQRGDMEKVLAFLDSSGEFVLAGDFNAPRGGEIFGMLAQKYTDNVPPHYTTSIDGSLHRGGAIPFMVDGIFSTPRYSVSKVELVSGVSDHCAIVAHISKKG